MCIISHVLMIIINISSFRVIPRNIKIGMTGYTFSMTKVQRLNAREIVKTTANDYLKLNRYACSNDRYTVMIKIQLYRTLMSSKVKEVDD